MKNGSAGITDVCRHQAPEADTTEPLRSNWPVLRSGWTLMPGSVLVVASVLRLGESHLAAIEQWLSPEECERADRFRLPELRRRFVASRGVLRSVLAGCVGCHPAELRFHAGPNGKPALATSPGLHFNLTHSHELVMLAVSRQCELGVDVERVRVMKDARAIARRFFTPREAAWIEANSPADRDEGFFRLWTRKEAVLKACGLGIAHGLDKLEVLDEDGGWRNVVRHPESDERDWKLVELHPSTGFPGALAVSPTIEQIRCHQWVGLPVAG